LEREKKHKTKKWRTEKINLTFLFSKIYEYLYEYLKEEEGGGENIFFFFSFENIYF